MTENAKDNDPKIILSDTYGEETEVALLQRENKRRTLMFGFSWGDPNDNGGGIKNGN